MLSRKWVALMGLLASLAGCASKSYVDRLPEFHQARPSSILVVPIVNHSVEVDAPHYVLSTLTRVIAEKGYYVFPVNTVKTVLEFEGLYEPAEVHAQDTNELAELFGADAVLFVEIHEWRAEYLLLQTTTYVDLEYRLVGSEARPLWASRKRVSYTPNHNTGSGGLAGLVASALVAAVERADPRYMALTRSANEDVFLKGAQAFPPGPYSPRFDAYYQDLEAQAEKAAASP